MDKELAATVARIDERTKAILDNQHALGETFKEHEQQDREDFKTVHGRITALERKQSWILGIGTTLVFAITAAIGFAKTFIGG